MSPYGRMTNMAEGVDVLPGGIRPGALDPVPNLTQQWGQLAADARRKIASLTTTLRELDRVREALAGHDLDVSEDLGPIGNAAAAARRDLEKDTKPTFSFPAPRQPVHIVEYGPWALHEPGTAVARLYRAVMLAPTVHVCEALLRGEKVPLDRLDADMVRRLR